MLGLLTVCVAALGVIMVLVGRASWLEAVAFATGAVGVWLTVKENVWNFPIGLVNTAGYSVVFFRARLYGDASLNVVYCILGVMGWYLWLFGGERHSPLRVSRAGRTELGLVAMFAVLSTLLLWKTLHALGGSASFWDAATTSLSLGAQWLLNRKRVENWYVWIVADAIYVPLYVSRGLNLTALLYAVFLVMATIGLLRWRETYEEQQRRPLDRLSFLEPCVPAYLVKRVVVIGAESTGKTTLARMLAERFETEWVPEFGREHWKRKIAGHRITDPPPSWSRDEFLEIATEQQAREEAAARRANRVLFADTNAFATGTWYERYHHARDPRVDAIGARDKVDLYLLTAPDVPFVQDGVRDGEHIREWMDLRLVEQLAKGSAPVLRLAGPYEPRFEKAVAAVERLLGKVLVP